MNIKFFVNIGLCLFFGFFTACKKQEPERIPVRDFFAYAEKTNFRISPNGQYITYLGGASSDSTGTVVNERGAQRQLFLINLLDDTLHARTVETFTNGVNSYIWISDQELLFSVRSQVGKDQSVEAGQDTLTTGASRILNITQLYLANVNDGSIRELTPPFSNRLRFISTIKDASNEVVISMNARDSSVFDAYKLNVSTGHFRLVSENPGNIIEWYSDLQGQVRLALSSDSIRETIWFRETEQKPFNPVISYSFHNAVIPMGFVHNNANHIYALSSLNRDKLSLVEIDLRTGREMAKLFEHSEVDVYNSGYLKGVGKVGYALYFTWRRNRHFLDDNIRRVYERLEERLPGYEFRVLDTDIGSKRLILNAFTDRNPGVTYFFDSTTDRLIKLGESNPRLNENRMASMQPVSYQSRDSLRIHAYLTLPNGASPSKLPVIVFPHGGPNERNAWGFDRTAQFFANRGYAVFQMNYRGSVGYGKGFWTAGFKEWGGKIQDDIADGVRWLVEEGIADVNRIGIYGVGFGGYSALHGACFNPELYACVASYGGFTNLFTHIKEIPPHFKPYLQKYYEIIGNPESDAMLMRQMSPVFHVDNIQVPVFIAQGGRDSRTTLTESRQFVQKLLKRKIPVTYIMHPDEDRYFRKEENLVGLYEELGNFFDTHLKKN